MGRLVNYRCTGCGERLRFEAGFDGGRLKHWLGRVDDHALLCGVYIRTKDAPLEMREHWRAIDRARRAA